MKTLLYVLLLTMIINFVSCGHSPEMHYYLVELPEQENDIKQARYPVTVAVDDFEAAPLYKDDRLVYRESPFEAKFYHYRRWVTSPAKMTTEQFIDQLRHSGLVQNAVRFNRAGFADYLIRGKIQAFEEWDQPDRWFGKVSFDITVEDLKNKELIWQGTLTKMTPVEKKQPRDVVKALSESLNECIDDFLSALDRELAKRR
ncbi:membrane integrity-associated transporter subunit PqiC [candidate division KSB1 bacterium]|nr:membrane integrity-associated transporter subunit PqiC [candidate division KSB1 bacterium]